MCGLCSEPTFCVITGLLFCRAQKTDGKSEEEELVGIIYDWVKGRT